MALLTLTSSLFLPRPVILLTVIRRILKSQYLGSFADSDSRWLLGNPVHRPDVVLLALRARSTAFLLRQTPIMQSTVNGARWPGAEIALCQIANANANLRIGESDIIKLLGRPALPTASAIAHAFNLHLHQFRRVKDIEGFAHAFEDGFEELPKLLEAF